LRLIASDVVPALGWRPGQAHEPAATRVRSPLTIGTA
jgi:hypothetical protein